MKIAIGHLYPDIMSAYGDRGNIDTIRRRCAWRDIGTDVAEVRLGDPLPADLDLIMIGGGGESQQQVIARDLYAVKGSAIRAAVAGGAAALAIGAGFELLGRFCQPERGAELPGAGLFDCWTIRSGRIRPGRDEPSGEARAERHIGNLVVRWGNDILVGAECHSGDTYLGASAEPLGEVLTGHGNCGSGVEGVVVGGAIGTNLRGPCLPLNPALADFLIVAALGRRHQTAELAPLPDDVEEAARTAAVTSLRRARQRSGAAR